MTTALKTLAHNIMLMVLGALLLLIALVALTDTNSDDYYASRCNNMNDNVVDVMICQAQIDRD